jgi:hypothetical protein
LSGSQQRCPAGSPLITVQNWRVFAAEPAALSSVVLPLRTTQPENAAAEGVGKCAICKPAKDVVWFALNDDRPPFALAGIWTEFKGDRVTKSKPIPGPHLVHGFLTTAPNAIVEPIHPKAMPVIDDARGIRRLDARAVG